MEYSFKEIVRGMDLKRRRAHVPRDAAHVNLEAQTQQNPEIPRKHRVYTNFSKSSRKLLPASM